MSGAVRLPQSLLGRTILLTAERRKDELECAVHWRGGQVRHGPALGMISHVDDEQLLADTHTLLANPPEVLVVTTGVGFRGWLEAVDSRGDGDRLRAVLTDTTILARGPKARGAIQEAGLPRRGWPLRRPRQKWPSISSQRTLAACGSLSNSMDREMMG